VNGEIDMFNTKLADPIARYLRAANAQDVNAVAACFTSDAVVRDEDRDRRGTAEVRAWADEVSQKYRPIVEPLSVSEKGATILVGRVSGTFPGSPLDLRYAFTLKGRKIARLEITP
jgi:hypothetical protein